MANFLDKTGLSYYTSKLKTWIYEKMFGYTIPESTPLMTSSGKIQQTYLPSYVDDVIEGYYYNSKFYAESAHTTEITAETGKIYVDITSTTGKSYRWTGTQYIAISGSTSGTVTAVKANNTEYDPDSSGVVNIGTVITSLPAATSSVAGIAKLDASGGSAAYSHAHGNITNAGAITATAVTPASGDYLVVSDNSNSSKLANGIAIGTDTTTYLRNDGTWQTPTDTQYTFVGGTNQFTVTPAGGTAQTVAVTPPDGSSSTKGIVKVDGTTITASSGVISVAKVPVTDVSGSTTQNAKLSYASATSAISGMATGDIAFVPDDTGAITTAEIDTLFTTT